MGLQDYLAIATFAFALAGVVFTLGKQAQCINQNAQDINSLARKFDKFCRDTDRRLDSVATLTTRLDQCVTGLERDAYGGNTRPQFRSPDDSR